MTALRSRRQEGIEENARILRDGAGPEVGPPCLSGHLEDELAIDHEARENDHAMPIQALASDLSALQDAHGLEVQGL